MRPFRKNCMTDETLHVKTTKYPESIVLPNQNVVPSAHKPLVLCKTNPYEDLQQWSGCNLVKKLILRLIKTIDIRPLGKWRNVGFWFLVRFISLLAEYFCFSLRETLQPLLHCSSFSFNARMKSTIRIRTWVVCSSAYHVFVGRLGQNHTNVNRWPEKMLPWREL